MKNLKENELNNFLSVFTNTIAGARGTFAEGYDKGGFCLPRIYCNDGFNISIQTASGCYCGSENGIRTFGMEWKLVEWGFPSMPIDGQKYSAEDDEDTTNTVGGYVELSLMEELLDEHGGIDYPTTFEKAYEKDKLVFLPSAEYELSGKASLEKLKVKMDTMYSDEYSS